MKSQSSYCQEKSSAVVQKRSGSGGNANTNNRKRDNSLAKGTQLDKTNIARFTNNKSGKSLTLQPRSSSGKENAVISTSTLSIANVKNLPIQRYKPLY